MDKFLLLYDVESGLPERVLKLRMGFPSRLLVAFKPHKVFPSLDSVLEYLGSKYSLEEWNPPDYRVEAIEKVWNVISQTE